MELYNLKRDLAETKNLAEQYPIKAEKLLIELKEWRKSVDAQMLIENPDYDPYYKKPSKKKKKNLK